MGADEKTPLKEKSGGGTFSGVVGTILSCLGCAVGTGNMWRFPRIVATSSGQNGALVFLLIWVVFLFLWSIPVILIEYSAGRFTRKGVVQTFLYFLGPKALWCSFWIGAVNLFISGYYLVIVGWCVYYCFYFMVHPLPTDFEASRAIFTAFTEDSYWSVLLLVFSISVVALTILKGVKTLEMTNMVLIPTLLVIIFAVFVWSLMRENAIHGLKFMFAPDWGSFLDTSVWVNAASQNAFDTSAGTGQFVAYAAFMSREQSIVKYSLGVPIGNNLVSLLSGMTTFSTSFSSLLQTNPNITNQEILAILQTSGPGGTGITFMWLPVLLQSAGTLGRIVAVFIFLAMVFAGVTSSVAYLETVIHPLEDFGVPRMFSLPVAMVVQFCLGIGPALNLNVLSSQDTTWGYALLIVGLMLQIMVIKYGANKYRKEIINKYGPHDLKAPKLWSWMLMTIVPVETAAILLWWLIGGIVQGTDGYGNPWYSLSYHSIMTSLLQWVGVILLTILVNAALLHFTPTKALIAATETEMQTLAGADSLVGSEGGDSGTGDGQGGPDENVGEINKAADES